MSCGNPYKHMLQNAFHSFLCIFTVIDSNSRALNDEKWNVCNLGFVPLFQSHQKKFSIFIINK